MQDSLGKVGLLNEEVAFTEALTTVYGRIDRIRRSLDAIQESILRDDVVQTINPLITAEDDLRGISIGLNSRVNRLLSTKLSRLREDTTASLLDSWRSMVYFDRGRATFYIKHDCRRKFIGAFRNLTLIN